MLRSGPAVNAIRCFLSQTRSTAKFLFAVWELKRAPAGPPWATPLGGRLRKQLLNCRIIIAKSGAFVKGGGINRLYSNVGINRLYSKNDCLVQTAVFCEKRISFFYLRQVLGLRRNRRKPLWSSVHWVQSFSTHFEPSSKLKAHNYVSGITTSGAMAYLCLIKTIFRFKSSPSKLVDLLS